jgi:hypothetical protein
MTAASSLLLLACTADAQVSVEMVELWLVQLRGRDLELARQAWNKLLAVGPPLVPRYVEYLAEPSDASYPLPWNRQGWELPSPGANPSLAELVTLAAGARRIVPGSAGLFDRSDWIESAAEITVSRPPEELVVALLGHMGAAAEPAVPILLQLYEWTDRSLAAQCFWALTRPGLRVLPALRARLRELEPTEELAVVRLLHLLASVASALPAQAIPLLVPFLASESGGVLTAAATELARLGQVVVPAVRERLPAAKGTERLACMAILSHVLSGPELHALLASGLEDTDQAVRGHAAVALAAAAAIPGRLTAEATNALVDKLLAQVRVDSADVREILAVGSFGKLAQRAAPAVVQAVSASDSELRRAAVLAVAGLGPAARAALPRLLELLREASGWEVIPLLAALTSIEPGPESADLLGQALRDAWRRIPRDPRDPLRPPEALEVVRALGRVPAPRAVVEEILADAVQSGDWRLRGLAYSARWRVEAASRGAILAELMGDLGAAVSSDRRAAALALADLGHDAAAAAAALSQALQQETHGETRDTLTQALERLR